MDVSIIIVNYNTKDLLFNCLSSIYKNTKDIVFEVIVSDNCSKDGSIEMIRDFFPQVILIENKENLGFGAANNRGLNIANGKYIFYLNSDTILLNNAVKLFFDYWENSYDKNNLGALGCLLLDEEGNPNHFGDSFPIFEHDLSELIHSIYGFSKHVINHIVFRKPLPLYTPSTIEKYKGDIDYIIGADLFLKNDKHAYFDEDFFMYCEETYLQYLLAKNNKKRIIIEGPEIIHLEGKSSKKVISDLLHKETSFSALQNKISRIIYYRKTGIKKNQILIYKIVLFIFWLNPYIIKKSKHFFIKLLLA